MEPPAPSIFARSVRELEREASVLRGQLLEAKEALERAQAKSEARRQQAFRLAQKHKLRLRQKAKMSRKANRLHERVQKLESEVRAAKDAAQLAATYA